MCESGTPGDGFSGITHPTGREFAGIQTCMECHPAITQSHQKTPHYHTSSSDFSQVKGSFDSGSNVLVLNERVRIVMVKENSTLFQKGFVDNVEVERKPFDITIGSGRKGQSYLYWQNNSLFQLPVSYYAPRNTWSNSPGYPVDQLVFNRSIPSRCLECHSTYFRIGKSVGSTETFYPDQALLGVQCERCHGPAADHVAFHRKHPADIEPRHIVNPANLSRQQKLDNCALCHSGLRDNIMPSFSFLVGDKLEDFSYPGSPADSAATLDVHGNQYGLLTASKCFKQSEMDCSSCHNVHARETNQLKLFSTRCMSCHPEGTQRYCKQPGQAGLDLKMNCIDCHMPSLPSRQVFLRTSDNINTTPFFVRTHLIGVYEEKVEHYLKGLRAPEAVR